MICKKCKKEIDSDLKKCPYCNEDLESVVTDEDYNVKDESRNNDSKSDSIDFSKIKYDVELSVARANADVSINKLPSKNKKKIIIVSVVVTIIVCLVLMAVITVSVIVPNAKLSKAQKYIDDGNYVEAVVILDEYAKKENDIKKIEEAIEKNVDSLIKNNEYDAAIEYLEGLNLHHEEVNDTINEQKNSVYLKKADYSLSAGKYSEAVKLYDKYAKSAEDVEKINEAIDKAINSLLDAGNYDKAYSYLTGLKLTHKETEKHIKTKMDNVRYEAMVLYCSAQYRKRLKRPSSFELVGVEIYLPPASSLEDKSVCYPFIVLACSGTNGYGGVGSSYSMYSVTEMEIVETISSDALASPKDDYDVAVALIIYEARENQILLCDNVNVNRITKILNDGVEYSINMDDLLITTDERAKISVEEKM